MFLQSHKSIVRVWAFLPLIAGVGLAAPASATETPSTGSQYSNRLAGSNNPYLLLHADNPVDWYPWGPEAIERARAEDKPIFLSVGYSTCYWCHVAERTLYSVPEIAELMNKWFINVKVDREQRPDVDQVYIVAQQLIAGTSGWPNNVFLTPDLKPFYAGSYFPPVTDARSPGFPQVLANIHRAWTTNRSDIISYAETVHAAMRQLQKADGNGGLTPITPTKWLDRARQSALQRFDQSHGGFATEGSKTKFPQTPTLQLLLTDYALNGNPEVRHVLISTLDAMAYGGIRDQIGGGFHRYSTDSAWSVPHYEKMLYDNAQLLRLYAQSYKVLGEPLYRYVAQDVGRYLVEQMMAPEGGFYTAQDAQVEGIEGASYAWRRGEVEKILGTESATQFFKVYELTPGGPGSQLAQAADLSEPGVLRVRLPIAAELARSANENPVAIFQSLEGSRAQLMAERSARPQPLRDEKINVDLNGLAIEAFVRAGTALDIPAYIEHARRAAERVWTIAYDPTQAQLKHQIFQGQAEIDGFLSDYALFGRALLSLHGATGDPVWRQRAALLADAIVNRFVSADGILNMTANRSELPLAVTDTDDDVYPSGTSATVDLWLRLAAMDGSERFAVAAQRLLRGSASRIAQRPEGWATAVAAVNTAEARALIAGFAPAEESQAASTSVGKRSTGGMSFSSADHVRIAGAIRETSTTVEVTLEIDRGYHVNANPASDDYLIPTTLSFENIEPVHIAYPEPIQFKPSFSDTPIDVYEHKPALVATFGSTALKDSEVLRGKVSVQACNDQLCLPPSKLPVSIRLSDSD